MFDSELSRKIFGDPANKEAIERVIRAAKHLRMTHRIHTLNALQEGPKTLNGLYRCTPNGRNLVRRDLMSLQGDGFVAPAEGPTRYAYWQITPAGVEAIHRYHADCEDEGLIRDVNGLVSMYENFRAPYQVAQVGPT